MYLRKAALAANAMGNKEQALGFAQRIQTNSLHRPKHRMQKN